MALLCAAPQVMAQIEKFPPAIIAIAPPSVLIPSLATVLRVSGTNFAPGGQVFFRSSGVIVERTNSGPHQRRRRLRRMVLKS